MRNRKATPRKKASTPVDDRELQIALLAALYGISPEKAAELLGAAEAVERIARGSAR